MYSSTRTCPTKLALQPRSTISCNSISLRAIPPPRPPRVYATLIITGYDNSSATFFASSKLVTVLLLSTGTPASRMESLKSCLSSVFLIPCTCVPSTLTSYFCRIPASSNFTPQFNAVCPPYANMIPSGRSFSTMDSTYLGVTGKR